MCPSIGLNYCFWQKAFDHIFGLGPREPIGTLKARALNGTSIESFNLLHLLFNCKLMNYASMKMIDATCEMYDFLHLIFCNIELLMTEFPPFHYWIDSLAIFILMSESHFEYQK